MGYCRGNVYLCLEGKQLRVCVSILSRRRVGGRQCIRFCFMRTNVLPCDQSRTLPLLQLVMSLLSPTVTPPPSAPFTPQEANIFSWTSLGSLLGQRGLGQRGHLPVVQ